MDEAYGRVEYAWKGRGLGFEIRGESGAGGMLEPSRIYNDSNL